MNAITTIEALDMSTDMFTEAANTPAYYKFGATVTKWHKLPRTPENIKAHAEALFAQLATRQKPKTPVGIDTCPCASRTWHSDGKQILAAIRSQQRANLARALEAEHNARTDAQVRAAYDAIMNGGPDANRLVKDF